MNHSKKFDELDWAAFAPGMSPQPMARNPPKDDSAMHDQKAAHAPDFLFAAGDAGLRYAVAE